MWEGVCVDLSFSYSLTFLFSKEAGRPDFRPDMVFAALVLIVFMFVLPLTASPWQHQIYVDLENGVYDESCWDGGWLNPCAELNLALKGAQHYNLSTALFIQPGNYSLENREETQFFSMNQLAMIGNSSSPGEVVIHCPSAANLVL